MSNWNNREKTIVLLCLLLLVLMMLVFIPEKKEWGTFCGAVAILYAILCDKQSKK